jgi:UDP-glucose 4-epimerase
MRQRILITGINGFIGSNVADSLKEDYEIVGLGPDSVCDVEGVSSYIQMILPSADLDDVFEAHVPDYCIHCAGPASVPFSMKYPSIDFSSGPVVMFQILDTIRKQDKKCRIIYLSSAAVYGNPLSFPISETSPTKPISPYGFHKLLCEKLIEEFSVLYNVEYLILRIFSVYGVGLRKQLFWDVVRKIMIKDLTFQGSGSETRDFIHIKDLSRLIQLFLNKNISRMILNVGSGVETTIKQAVEIVAGEMGYRDSDIRFSGHARDGDPSNWLADVSKLSELGFSCSVPIYEGIKDYVYWASHLSSHEKYT